MSDYSVEAKGWSKWCWACEKTHLIQGLFCGWCGTKQGCEKCSSALGFGRLKYCTECGTSRPKRAEHAKHLRRDKQTADRKIDLDIEAFKHDDKLNHSGNIDWVSVGTKLAAVVIVVGVVLGSLVILAMVQAVFHNP